MYAKFTIRRKRSFGYQFTKFVACWGVLAIMGIIAWVASHA